MIQEIKGTRKRRFWFCPHLSPQGKREAVGSYFVVAEEEAVQVGKPQSCRRLLSQVLLDPQINP